MSGGRRHRTGPHKRPPVVVPAAFCSMGGCYCPNVARKLNAGRAESGDVVPARIRVLGRRARIVVERPQVVRVPSLASTLLLKLRRATAVLTDRTS